MRRLRERRRAERTCSECQTPLAGSDAGICTGCKSKFRDSVTRSATTVARRIGFATIDDDDGLGHLSAAEIAQLARPRATMPRIQIESVTGDPGESYVNADNWNTMRERPTR